MEGRRAGLSRLLSDKLVLAVCVVVSVSFLSMNESTRMRWAGAMAHRLVTPVEWLESVFDGAIRLKKENQELRSKLAALELDLYQLAAQRAELEALQSRAGFFEHTRGHMIPASVLELMVHRFPLQAKIRSLGDADSLQMWQPVVTENGLAGRIREVLAPDVALVQLLTDQDSRISVQVEGSGVIGLLRYDGRRFRMDHVPRGEPIEVGDLVQTSGLGGTVPRGLPIGVVQSVESNPAELFQTIQIEPAVRFTALSDVYVVVRPGPWYSRQTDSVPVIGELDSIQDPQEARR